MMIKQRNLFSEMKPEKNLNYKGPFKQTSKQNKNEKQKGKS